MKKFSTSFNLSKKKPQINNDFNKKIKSRLLKKNINLINHGGYRVRGLYKHKSKNLPLVSIITVVKNNEKYLEQTILSVLNQRYFNLEYIIIDGNSKDNSKKIIKKYENHIDYWVSAKDRGIYDAFNIGLSLSNGDYIGFINSDDIFTKNALVYLKKYIKKKYDFVFGSVKKHWGLLYGYKPEKIWYTWGFYTSHSSGFFINHNAMQKVGKYNLKYKYSSDYDYFYRMIVKHRLNGTASKKSEIFGIFRRGGFSSRIKFRDHLMEELIIRKDNNQSFLILVFILMLKIMFNFKKFITNK